MKVFTPKEIQETKGQQTAKDIARIQTVREALSKAQTELNTNDAAFNLALANQRVRWTREEEEATNKIALLKMEVKDLEEKKKVLLSPIEKIKEEATLMVQEAQKSLDDVHIKEEEVQKMSEALSDKIDENSEWSEVLSQREEQIVIKEKNILEQDTMIKQLSSALSTKWNEFFEANAKKDKEYLDKRTELVLFESNLVSRETSLKIESQRIAKEKQLILSQRRALITASKEIQHGRTT